MTRAFPWGVLGIGPDADERAVRRAYAAQLRAIDPDADHDKFDRLRNARDRALALVRSGASAESQPPEPPMAFDDVGGDWLDDEDDDADDGFRRPEELRSPAFPVDPATTITPVSVDVAAPPVTLVPPTLSATEQERDDTLSLIPPAPPVNDDTLDFGSITGGSGTRPSSAPKAPTSPGITAPRLAAPVLDVPVMPRSALVMPHLGGATGSPSMGDHQEGLIQLLLDVDPNVVATDDEREQISDHLRAILADPSTQNISSAADIERWLAEVFARSTPRSHPWAQWLADHFNWRAEVGTINQSPAIAWLAERAVAFDFRDKVTQPGNKGYKAWQELTTPAHEGSRRGNVKHVRDLLSVVRENYPVLEQEFDWHRVSLWDRPQSSGGGGGGVPWWGIGIGLFMLLRLIAGFDTSDNRYADPISPQPPAVVAPLDGTYRTTDNFAYTGDVAQKNRLVARALQSIGDFSLSSQLSGMQRDTLIQPLETILSRAVELNATESVALAGLEQALLDRIRSEVSRANNDDVVNYRRAQARMLRELAVVRPSDCYNFLIARRLPSLFSGSQAASEMRLANSAILLSARSPALPSPTTRDVYALETTTLDASRRAGMTKPQWDAAFSSESASARDVCIANAALFEAALASSDRTERMRILRSSL